VRYEGVSEALREDLGADEARAAGEDDFHRVLVLVYFSSLRRQGRLMGGGRLVWLAD
jgi:hypothetical protein